MTTQANMALLKEAPYKMEEVSRARLLRLLASPKVLTYTGLSLLRMATASPITRASFIRWLMMESAWSGRRRLPSSFWIGGAWAIVASGNNHRQAMTKYLTIDKGFVLTTNLFLFGRKGKRDNAQIRI